MSERSTFSPFWHRVRVLRPRLRPHVQITRQHYRGRRWHVVHDPSSNQFFRLNVVAHEFVGLLDGRRTVEEVWQDSLTRHGDGALTQNEVIQLLSQLFAGNLLSADIPPETEQLLSRGKERVGQRVKQQAIGLMYFRVRLFNPDALLAWIEPVMRPLLNRWGFMAWVVLVVSALVSLLPHWEALISGVDSAVSPDNLFLMGVVFVATKLWHELGHGVICKRLGGQVPEFGAMLLVLVPSPYVDATAAWAFKSKWQRMAVGAGGMIFELFVAAIAAFVWLRTPEGSTLHQVAYNVLFLSSVATVVFNANPLMRFDGYYILSDWLEVPNLAHRSNQMLKFLFQKHVYRVRGAVPPTGVLSEAVILLVYGVAAMAYRMFLFISISLYVMGKMFALGLFLAVWTAATWFIMPVGGFAHWLATSPHLAHRRGRALLTSLALMGVALLLVGVIPAPDRRRAVGVLEPVHRSTLFSAADGFVASAHVRPGQRVKKGDAIVTMESDRLVAERRHAVAQLQEAESRRDASVARNIAESQVASDYCRTLREHLGLIDQRLAGLTIVAPHDGVIVTNDPATLVGAFVEEGSPICEIVDDQLLRVTAVLTQPESSWIVTEPYTVEGRLVSGPRDTFACIKDRVLIAGTRELPHPSLGHAGGGPIEIDRQEESGRLAKGEVFRGYFFPAHDDGLRGPGLVAGGRGRPGERVSLRFELPSKPLLVQWTDRLRKTLQGRAKV